MLIEKFFSDKRAMYFKYVKDITKIRLILLLFVHDCLLIAWFFIINPLDVSLAERCESS